MNCYRKFSIIELLTVVLVILLLLTLTIPIFVNLKINARAVICKGQLRQVGLLITSYASDNNGYLPNDDAFNRDTKPYARLYSDLGWNRNLVGGVYKNELDGFYQNWNGHLLPYLNFDLPQKYFRGVNGVVVNSGGSNYVEIQPKPTPAQDIFNRGWVVLNETLANGGYNDLKVFICPEVHNSVFDITGIKLFNGLQVPKIGLLMYKPSLYGVPSTYLANSIYFGEGIANSKRLDELVDISKKALIIEGGGAFPDNFCPSVYYFPNNNYNISNAGGLIANFDIGDEANQKLNFPHNSIREFWIKGGKKANFFALDYFPKYHDLAKKFNIEFAGKASMVAGPTTSSSKMSYSIVSYVDPENGAIFKPFFSTNSTLDPLGNWTAFVNGMEQDYHALVGSMNVLFGDGSVALKDNAWLCNNRMEISDSPN